MERAEAYAAQAFDAYGQKDYSTAVALYRKAYATFPTADMLFNIARIYDVGLADRALAIRFYREYVVDPEAEVQRVQIAFERLARLEAPGAVTVAPPAQAAAASAEPKPASTDPTGAVAASQARLWTPLRVGAIVAGTVGLVGIGVGAGFGVAALADAGTAREYCAGNRCDSQRGVDAAHSASKSANIATVGFALGGTLLAAGVALLWSESGSGSAEHADARVEWTSVATDSQLGLGLSGRW